MVGNSLGRLTFDLEKCSFSHHHNAPEDLAGAMGCYPTGGFYEPDSGPAAARLRRKLLSDPPVQLFIQPGPRFKIKNHGFTILCLSTVRASRD
jgi:hypothetical protein